VPAAAAAADATECDELGRTSRLPAGLVRRGSKTSRPRIPRYDTTKYIFVRPKAADIASLVCLAGPKNGKGSEKNYRNNLVVQKKRSSGHEVREAGRESMMGKTCERGRF